MSDLLKLAEQIEAADGPSRELDVRIAVAIDAPHGKADWAPFGDDCAAAYTADLNAAPTLVPEGWCWQIRFDPRMTGAVVLRQNGFDQHHTLAATPALALCAAALRARAGAA